MCEMLCRCKSCVVKEEEDDAKVFRKSPSTKQNKFWADTFEKFKNFTRFWCFLMCVR